MKHLYCLIVGMLVIISISFAMKTIYSLSLTNPALVFGTLLISGFLVCSYGVGSGVVAVIKDYRRGQ